MGARRPRPGLHLTCSARGEDKWRREQRAFHGLLPGLLSTNPGQYVAIHEGQVVVRAMTSWPWRRLRPVRLCANLRKPSAHPARPFRPGSHHRVGSRDRRNDPVYVQPTSRTARAVRPCLHTQARGRAWLHDLPAQIDTAAVRTVIPGGLVARLGLVPLDELPVAGFGGQVLLVSTYLVEVTVRGQPTQAVEVLAPRANPTSFSAATFSTSTDWCSTALAWPWKSAE